MILKKNTMAVKGNYIKAFKYLGLYIFFLMYISDVIAQENESCLTIELTAIKRNKSVFFKYSLKNHSQDTVVFNIASTCNTLFFTLVIDDENGNRVPIKTPKVRANYRYIFETDKYYTTIFPSKQFKKRYKTYGFNFKMKKLKLIKLKLPSGKYNAWLVYYLNERNLHFDNIKHPLYQKLWSGELRSEKIEFIIE